MAEDTRPLITHGEQDSGSDQSLTLPAPHEEDVRVAKPSINVGNVGLPKSETTSVPSQPTRISGYSVVVQAVQPQGDLPSIQYRDRDFEAGRKYDKYIIVGLIAGFLCFWPFGLCAAYYAMKAKVSAIYREEEETALYTSRATALIVWAVFTGFLILLVIFSLSW